MVAVKVKAASHRPSWRDAVALTGPILVLVGAFVLMLAISLAYAGVGMQDHPVRANPDPGPSPVSPLWGITNWSMILTVAFGAIALGLLAGLIRMSVRRGSPHPGLLVFVATVPMALLDPPGNWATFTVYNPDLLHVPIDWPLVRLSPVLEPILALYGAYPMYFFSIAALTYWFVQRVLVPRASAESFFRRHPLLTLFVAGFIIDIPLDTAFQVFVMRSGVYFYSQALGPTLSWGHISFPIVLGLWDWIMVGAVSILLARNDRGQSLVLSRIARRTMPAGRRGIASASRQAIVGMVFTVAVTGIPLSLYTAIRVSGITHPMMRQWPYPEVKVYDPYGDVQDAGLPGPYYTK